ncbi:MAG TPA: 8-oxo-dGTP diphosphatase [Candidatus Fimimorpha faecalis]|uniref:8-oxo-dGTP diphosphatase n=1 Tax=Candidatus Fimimorpha faecalis TaxID=2840824 RepID=A0A9D1JDF8_9FIRM|nr:8-oxo-dGTP diphosphatase [Candidatus Fimimorpha faecalis]
MDKTERVELTTLCLIYQGNKLLLQDRKKEDWKGYTFPGGHVNRNESIVDAVIREIKEETGLTISHPQLCGIKQFPIENGRYLVFLFKTSEFEGTLHSSNEGKMEWVDRNQLANYKTAEDFEELLHVIEDNQLTEFQYIIQNDDWNIKIK